jgi:hypothetical protein
MTTATSDPPANLAKLDGIYYKSAKAWHQYRSEANIRPLRDISYVQAAESQESVIGDTLGNPTMATEPSNNIQNGSHSAVTANVTAHATPNHTAQYPTVSVKLANMTNFTNMSLNHTSLSRQKREGEDKNVEAVKEVISTLPVGKAYVAKKYHYFRKEVPFAQMFAELTSLNFNLRSMNPTGVDSSFKEVQGKNSKFLQTKLPKSFAQNSLTCAEIGGSIVSWSDIVTENIPITTKTATADTVRIGKNTLSCEIYGAHRIEMQCFETIKSIAQTTGLAFTNKSFVKNLGFCTVRYMSDIHTNTLQTSR